MLRIVMTAAHGGYDSERVPLGGGAAVCERLCREWAGRSDVEVTLLGPGPVAPDGVRYQRMEVLGEQLPSQLSELAYARFCRRFEKAITAYILAQTDPAVVICHDISEGPDFLALARAHVPCIPIFHVDVVDFFNRFYLGGWLPVRWLTWMYARLGRFLPMPDVLKLVFDKQEQAVQLCARAVVPSAPMRRVLRECYPGLAEDRVQVVPWGSPAQVPPAEAVEPKRRELCGRYGRPLLVTLSRISPEKGQDLLLQALRLGEARGQVLPGTTLVIAGQAAFMRGERYLKRLRRAAGQLSTTRVEFPGHVGGADKQALLEAADLFVVSSRHESYGLTIMEAMASGCPVVGVRSYGLDSTVDRTCGRVVERRPDTLWEALHELMSHPDRRVPLSQAARQRASEERFPQAAERLLELARAVCQPG